MFRVKAGIALEIMRDIFVSEDQPYSFGMAFGKKQQCESSK